MGQLTFYTHILLLDFLKEERYLPRKIFQAYTLVTLYKDLSRV